MAWSELLNLKVGNIGILTLVVLALTVCLIIVRTDSSYKLAGWKDTFVTAAIAIGVGFAILELLVAYGVVKHTPKDKPDMNVDECMKNPATVKEILDRLHKEYPFGKKPEEQSADVGKADVGTKGDSTNPFA